MLTRHTYQPEHEITFGFSKGQIMVNATEMAKPFGKQPKDFLRNQSTQEYINALAVRQNRLTGDIVRIVQGGDPNLQGTWFHQKLALRFAQWLSADFAVWVDERIEELLTTGKTSLVPSNASPLSLARHMLEAMEEQERRITTMEDKVTRIEAKVENVNEDYFSLAGYYKLRGRRFDLTKGEAQQAGKRLSSASKANGYTVSQVYHAGYGHVNTYHVHILKKELGF